MIWTRIDKEFVGFAWKRLASHEVDPSVSRGHEFQGVNALVGLLGEHDRQDIPTSYYSMGDDEDGQPSIRAAINSVSTWYNSRRNDQNRSAEWRLYYKPVDIQFWSNPGDLLVVGLRQDGSLAIMLISSESSTETAIRNLIGIGQVTPHGKGELRWIEANKTDIGLSATETLEQINLSFASISSGGIKPPLPAPDLDFSRDEAVNSLAEYMINSWPEKLGSSDQIVRQIILHSGVETEAYKSRPDETLQRWLEMGEASYRLWEKEVLQRYLGPIRFNRDVTDTKLAELVSERWMSFRQSRVSRAGKVMETLLNEIFQAWDVRFDWGTVLPGGKRPDFLFPGRKEYEDPDFDALDLRLLGSKTSLKERWRQILAEGQRVVRKHGVTRDDAITKGTFAEMAAENFTVVMPLPTIARYEHTPPNLVSLKDFLEEVRGLQAKEL